MNTMALKRLYLILISLAIIAAIIIYKTNPGIFTQKTLGSFEYVRRAEDLLDKGEYRKAIYYFEKAFRASPENRAIKKGLSWAYTRYAIALAESESYDSAIDYLTKAYQTTPDMNTAQNLAITYSKKALSQADRGNWYGAIDSFTDAREIASESNNAAKNLAISLFNDAVINYKSGEEKIAILCLNESSLINEDSRTFAFLGDIYYKRTELEKAVFYWKRALDLNPENRALLNEQLEKALKEMELAGREAKKELPHFDLRYEKSLALDPAMTKEALEKAYFDIGRDLSYFPSSKTVIFFYSEKDFKDIFKLPSAVRAFYDGNIRMPFPEGSLAKEEFYHYIYHEYTHAVISAMTANNCPVWFSEGIAVWEEFKGKDEAIPISDILIHHLHAVPGSAKLEFSLTSLDEAFKEGLKESDMRSYYILAYTVVRYIVENWGMDGLRAILKRLKDGQHIMNAIDDELLLSEKEFGRRWNAYLHKRYLSPS
ncbi:MAG: tetratricopeptide repeat protein [Candidatus Omnitrophica bacterium]|nr:tetratricopeptide repeat protein [Candidatus Omnitrophota bacterium]